MSPLNQSCVCEKVRELGVVGVEILEQLWQVSEMESEKDDNTNFDKFWFALSVCFLFDELRRYWGMLNDF